VPFFASQANEEGFQFIIKRCGLGAEPVQIAICLDEDEASDITTCMNRNASLAKLIEDCKTNFNYIAQTAGSYICELEDHE